MPVKQREQGFQRLPRRDLGRRSFLRLSAAAAAYAGLPLPRALAQGYPNRQITLICAFGAGTGTDTVARFVADGLGKATGQTIIVENRAGANGQIAARAVATASPDGYTVLFSSQTTHAMNPWFYKSLPYDPIKDFIPVSTTNRAPLVLVAPPSFPANNVQELVALARSKPGHFTFAHPNGSSRGGAELFKMLAKIDLRDVPYKTAPQALADLMGERVDMMWGDLFTCMPLIKDRKLKALGVTSDTRMDAAPEIPTIQEQGLPGYLFIAWLAAWVPANTPSDTVDRLASLIGSHVRANADWFKPTGNEAFVLAGADLAKFQAQELQKWHDIVKSAGIQPE